MTEEQKTIRAVDLFAILRQRILQWEYPPGYRFTEEELCKEFEVSRSPIREALRMLEENDLVERIPYRGCSVRQPDVQQINELYDVRVILEAAVAEQLARRGIASDVYEQLVATWQELARTPSHAQIDNAALALQDRAFHEQLAAATGNRTLCDMLHGINERLHFMRLIDITTPERLWETCRDHLQILEHIAAHNSEEARNAMQFNIEGARIHVERALKEVIASSYFKQYRR